VALAPIAYLLLIKVLLFQQPVLPAGLFGDRSA